MNATPISPECPEAASILRFRNPSDLLRRAGGAGAIGRLAALLLVLGLFRHRAARIGARVLSEYHGSGKQRKAKGGNHKLLHCSISPYKQLSDSTGCFQ